jgi:hypothetical protein
MRYLIQFFIIQLIVLFSFSGSLLALGKGIAMGSMTSVVSDGPFDAAKNPALLTLLESRQSLGIYGKYLAYNRPLVSFDAYFSGFDPEVDIAEQEKNSMACLFAYSARIGKPVIGFAVIEGDDGQFYSLNTKTEITATISGIGTVVNANEEKTEGNNPVFFTSIGFTISENSSIGFQLSLKYQRKNIISKEKSSIDSVDMAFVEKDITVQSLSYSAGAGYLYRDRDTQLGFVFNMGQFTWSHQDFRYRFEDINFSITEGTPVDNSSKGSDSYSSSGKYTRGMSFIAGGYQRISSIFSIALEGEFNIENTFKVTSLELYDDTSTDNEIYAVVETKNNISNNNSVFIRGGLEVNAFKPMTLMFGGGYILYIGRSNAIDADVYSSNRNAVYLFTCGAIYRYSERVSISVIGLVTQFDGEFLQQAQDASGRYSLELEQEETNVSLFAGVVYTF